MSRRSADVEGRRISLSNLEKVFYPDHGFTKAQVLDYYRMISRFTLPHLRDRALTLKRYPGGTGEEFFYEKRCPSGRPSWVTTSEILQDNGEIMTVCLINNLASLIWVENLASIELHVPLAKTGSPKTPDSVVFDLDPGEKAGILDCSRVALILKDLFAGLKLSSHVKTSGQKGLHVYIPLNRNEATFNDTKKFSRSVAEVMQRGYPDLVTSKMAKQFRKGKVFINWSQNDAHKTMVCVYSLRAREKPVVSCPLDWGELKDALEKNEPGSLEILYSDALKRAQTAGDLFKEVLTKKQRLPHL